MDFTLALTHFCEVHGPKSVLCTQVLPLECALCVPSPVLRPRTSSDTLATRIHDPADDDHHDFMTQSLHSTRTTGTVNSLPTGFSGASTNVDSEPDSPDLKQTRFHRTEDQSKGIDPQFKYGRAQGDTCASCAFTVPQSIASKLPKGAPGSLKIDDNTKQSSPVLRSREFVCLGQKDGNRRRSTQGGHSSSQESNGSSFRSSGSEHSHTDCHDHTLTYLTTKSPDDPENYAQLRASVIRTLSFEQLPKGLSDGPLYFGDSDNGYTIAYVFRLTDPKARGRRRAYAFVALAGKNGSRAIRASPMLWEAFATMANRIEHAAQRYQEEQKRKEEEEHKKRNYTPVSSFLAQRVVDHDGQLRRAGQTTPRSLADIVGDENIFAILHQYFVAVLQCLGDQFGGLHLAGEASIYQSLAGEEQEGLVHATIIGQERGDHKSEKVSVQHLPRNDVDKAKQKVNQKVQHNPQCGPIILNETVKGQVVI